ncbi:MAG: Na/Pi symporter [Flavobacteriaceae bacterium]|nr:Na/Pi symporter [Flavobacteriaceae bacterium]MDH3796242.1 Na/Pi symporter [Flavobacteriaceae bacterium]
MNVSLPLILGGLLLFIYSITRLSKVMEYIFTERARKIIEGGTKNLLISLVIGIVSTILLGSSSAVIIIAIIFINARSLTFKNAMGIIMGANIGTTFSSQLIALDLGKYAFIPILAGLLIYVFTKSDQWRQIGKAALFFGLLFFGLFLVQLAVMPLQENPQIEQWLMQIEGNPLYGTIMGGLITLIIQSSSATVGMAIIMGKQELIGLSAGIAIMLGSELGTCSDTLVATIRGSRQAIKAGVFHLLFNLSTICLGLLFFSPFVSLIEKLSGNAGLNTQIANAHVLFNTFGVLIFLPFTGAVYRLLNHIIPEKNQRQESD